MGRNRRFLAFLICGIMVVSLAVCGGDGVASAGVIELTFTTSLYVEEPHQVALDNLLEAYNSINPNVRITIYGAEYDRFWDNLTTEIISGNEADMIQVVPDFLASYHALRPGGAFVDLSPYMAGKNFEDNLVGQDKAQVDGVTVGLSNYAWGTTGLFYRKSIMEAAGIDPESIKNSDDFVEALRATTGDGVFGMGVVVGPHAFVVDEWMRFHARAVSGGVFFPEEEGPFTSDNINVNSPENVWAARWWQGLIQEGILRPDPDKRNARELYWNGMAAFNMDGPWFIGMTEQRDPAILDDTGLIPHPDMIYDGRVYKPRPGLSPYITSISTNSAHPDEAWAFMEWMASDEAQAIIATCGMTPASRSFAETDAYRAQYPMSYQFLGFMTDNYGSLILSPAIPQYQELLRVLIDAGQNMYSERAADPQAELDAAAEIMKAIMDY